MKKLFFGMLFLLLGTTSFGRTLEPSLKSVLIEKLGDVDCVATVTVTYYDSDGNVKGMKAVIASGSDCAEATENAKNLL